MADASASPGFLKRAEQVGRKGFYFGLNVVRTLRQKWEICEKHNRFHDVKANVLDSEFASFCESLDAIRADEIHSLPKRFNPVRDALVKLTNIASKWERQDNHAGCLEFGKKVYDASQHLVDAVRAAKVQTPPTRWPWAGGTSPDDGRSAPLADSAPPRPVASSLWRKSLLTVRERFAEAALGAYRLPCRLIHTNDYMLPEPSDLPCPLEISGMVGVAFHSGVRQEETTGQPIAFRWHTVYAERLGPEETAFCQSFLSIAADAGRCLDGLPPDVKRILWREWPKGFRTTKDYGTWIDAVFELAWQRIPGSTLFAERLAWSGATSVRLDALPALRRRAKRGGLTMAGIADIPDRPVYWYSVLKDLRSASVAAIDILLALDGENRDDANGATGEDSLLVSFADLATITKLKEKTLRNLASTSKDMPAPVLQESGANPARYDYAAVRIWAVRHRPSWSARLPERAEDARRMLDGEVST